MRRRKSCKVGGGVFWLFLKSLPIRHGVRPNRSLHVIVFQDVFWSRAGGIAMYGGTSLCFAPFRHLTLWRADQVRRLTGHDVDPGAKPSAQSFWHSGHLVRSATPRLNAVGALHTQGGPKCKTLRVVFKRVRLCFTCNVALSASIEQGRWIPSLPMQWAVRCWTDWNMWGDVGLWRGEEEMFQCGQSTKCTDEIFSLILNHSHHPPCPMSFHEFVIVCGLWQQSPVEISSWWSPLPRSHQSLQDVDEDVRELAALTLLHADEVDAAIASVLLWFCNAKNDSCLRNT